MGLMELSGSPGMYEFVKESNRIEGIHRPPTQAEIEAHVDLLCCGEISVADLERFVAVVAARPLRRQPGQDVRVGPHLPFGGGPRVERRLREILADANTDENPFTVHVEYETLHPFLDGNGRSGRALWAWMMRRQGHDPFGLGFLHRWYYDSLEAARGGADLYSAGDTVAAQADTSEATR